MNNNQTFEFSIQGSSYDISQSLEKLYKWVLTELSNADSNDVYTVRISGSYSKAKNSSSNSTEDQDLKNYSFSQDTSYDFDFSEFLDSTSDIVFPSSLRTKENLELIYDVASKYHLNSDEMRLVVGRSVNISPLSFDKNSIKRLAKTISQKKVTQDKYSLPPLLFLKEKLNGTEPTVTEKRILLNIFNHFNFSTEAFNIMVEYILIRSDNRLNQKFVDMVASTWERDGVHTREDALREVEVERSRNYKSGSNR